MSFRWTEDGAIVQDRPAAQKGRGIAAKTLRIIEAARTILKEIQPATVRGVCYRLFTAGVTSNMSRGETQKVSKALVLARENALIPWEWIVDESRHLESTSTWHDLAAYGESVVKSYRKNFWIHQPETIQIWSEKGTVRGILMPVLLEFDVGFQVMHGYGGATAIHNAAESTEDLERPLNIFYVGDFDPSGMHMSEVDLPGRLARYGGNTVVRRIALTAGDTASPHLPSFDLETKRGDPRYKWFRDNYGQRCWELDAMSPVVIRQRVRSAIESMIDQDIWEWCCRIEKAELESVRNFKWGDG